MFFIAKLVGYLLHPFVWILILLLLAWFTKNKFRRKRIVGITLIVALFFSNPWIIDNIFYRYQSKPASLPADRQYQSGIVLGGFMSYDEETREAYFNEASDRFIQTVRLFQLKRIQKIIVSGGNGSLNNNDFREADFIRKNLLDAGVPDRDILIESESKNTIENGRFVKRLTDSINYHDTALLITSAFHMPRATKIFEKAGLKVKPYPCAFMVKKVQTKFTPASLLPSFDALERWQLILRELVGKLKS
ncbi:YdcF family protein [Pollutibacter soli]|uniref:YdcF family protein n=1 Tax=Pollutibacter soli TaxID=3034157 RepID=UPI003013FCAF